MTSRRPAPRDRRGRPGLSLSAERAEQVRTAAETMAVGALFLLFSLPIVTIGSSWCAAAQIVAGWHRERELPLLRTFARVVRRDLAAGCLLAGALLAVACSAVLEVRVVLNARMPGYRIEAAALALLAAAAVGFVLLTVACRAAGGGSWQAAARTAAEQARSAPSTLLLAVCALACTAALVAVVPAFAGFMAGPLAYAFSAIVARNRGEGRAQGSPA